MRRAAHFSGACGRGQRPDVLLIVLDTVVHDLAPDPAQTSPRPPSTDGPAGDLVTAARDLIARTPRRASGPMVPLGADTELTRRLKSLGSVE